MPLLDLMLGFLAATAAFAYMTGPAMLHSSTQTLACGRRAGLMAALGIHLAGYAHVGAAARGLSAIFRHVPEAYLVIKLAAAAYLTWLGVGILRQRGGPGTALHFSAKSARRARKAFQTGRADHADLGWLPIDRALCAFGFGAGLKGAI